MVTDKIKKNVVKFGGRIFWYKLRFLVINKNKVRRIRQKYGIYNALAARKTGQE